MYWFYDALAAFVVFCGPVFGPVLPPLGGCQHTCLLDVSVLTDTKRSVVAGLRVQAGCRFVPFWQATEGEIALCDGGVERRGWVPAPDPGFLPGGVRERAYLLVRERGVMSPVRRWMLKHPRPR